LIPDLFKIKVFAGDSERRNCPVSFAIPRDFGVLPDQLSQELSMKDNEGNQVPVQVVDCGDVYRLDWIAKCKSNRLFVYNGQSLHAKDIAALIPGRMYRRHKKYRDIEYAAVNAELPGHGLSRLVIVRNLRESENDSESIPIKHLVCSKPGTHGSAIVTKYKSRWKVETFHRTVKQNFGLLTYHGRKLCGHIAHTALVYMAYTLTTFIQRCFPSLKGESIGYVVVRIIRAVARVKVSSSALTVLIPRDFPNSRFVREFQLANTG
jgi:hypothetical protein